MKVLVTGARGFIGRNLGVAVRRAGAAVAEVDRQATRQEWVDGLRDARVVFHLAGVNRPHDESAFHADNVGSLDTLLGMIEPAGLQPGAAEPPLIVFTSSVQAALDNPYGRSKLVAEQALEDHARRTGQPAVIYRLPGVFEKWCPPDRHS